MPAQRCAVYGCNMSKPKNQTEDDGETILNFFTFPKDEVRRALWVQACSRSDLTVGNVVGQKILICSTHFRREDITGNRVTRPRLNPMAVPCRNLPDITSADVEEFKSTVFPRYKRKKVRMPAPSTHIPVYDDASIGLLCEPAFPDTGTLGIMPEDVTETIDEPSLNHDDISCHPIHNINTLNPKWQVTVFDTTVGYFMAHMSANSGIQISKSLCLDFSHGEATLSIFMDDVRVSENNQRAMLAKRNIHKVQHFLELLLAVELYNLDNGYVLRSVLNKVKTLSASYDRVWDEDEQDLEPNHEDSVLQFVCEQLAMFKCKPQTRRWNPMMVQFAKLVHSLCPNVYRAILNTGFILLPCERTLSRLSKVPLTLKIELDSD